ncbi:MAG: 50S ribosomal protein L21 [Planctomycetes bacterium]|nr:50S ribosomal protein L21 [Planctomycetota bacterium]
MYAIVSDRNQQITVRVGDEITCDLMDAAPGSEVLFDNILLIAADGKIQVGKPLVAGASVKGEVLGTTRGKKLVIFRFKRRKNVRRKTGHRQSFTKVRITDISA